MPYRKVSLVDEGVYHVYSRSIAGYTIFNDSNDYGRMAGSFDFYSREDLPGIAGTNNIDAAKLEAIIKGFVKTAEEDMIDLINPELSGMNEKSLNKVKSMVEKREIANLMACVIPDGELIEIQGKGLYDVRIDIEAEARIYEQYMEDVLTQA